MPWSVGQIRARNSLPASSTVKADADGDGVPLLLGLAEPDTAVEAAADAAAELEADVEAVDAHEAIIKPANPSAANFPTKITFTSPPTRLLPAASHL